MVPVVIARAVDGHGYKVETAIVVGLEKCQRHSRGMFGPAEVGAAVA